MARKKSRLLKTLGPGLITGAADDDPSGIATHAQAGAAFGYTQLWALTVCLPLMIAVQEASARIGLATGHGLAKAATARYSKKVVYFMVILIVIANTINIGADIAAVGAALQLLIPLPLILLSTVFTFIVLFLEIFVGYHAYARFLKILSLAVLSYAVTAFLVSEPWREIFIATFVPQIQFNTQYLYVIVAIFGTTISPYMFFWQAAEEVEELEYATKKHTALRTLKELRIDTVIGMLFSIVGSWFILVTTATVLHNNGVTNINTAADAAKALEPLVQTFPNAGVIAKVIFAIGVIGMGLLGIPVLAGSASYAVSETFGLNAGLDKKAWEAKGFYGIIVISTLIGFSMTLIGIDPIKALIFAAVINGLVAVPLILIIYGISSNEEIMGQYVGGKLSSRMLLVTFFVMFICALALLISFIP
jgi:NRAMP (natural resistance-associated macrophage protein)-like metal ion transporter